MASCVKWSGLIGGAVRDKTGRVVVAPALARGGEVSGARRRSVVATMMELVGGEEGRDRRERGGRAQCWGALELPHLCVTEGMRP
jgi:hypothetical protein